MVVEPSRSADRALHDEAATFTDTFVLRLTPPAADRNPQTVTACG